MKIKRTMVAVMAASAALFTGCSHIGNLTKGTQSYYLASNLEQVDKILEVTIFDDSVLNESVVRIPLTRTENSNETCVYSLSKNLKSGEDTAKIKFGMVEGDSKEIKLTVVGSTVTGSKKESVDSTVVVPVNSENKQVKVDDDLYLKTVLVEAPLKNAFAILPPCTVENVNIENDGKDIGVVLSDSFNGEFKFVFRGSNPGDASKFYIGSDRINEENLRQVKKGSLEEQQMASMLKKMVLKNVKDKQVDKLWKIVRQLEANN